MKERLDTLVVKRGLVESREKAQRLILAGQVLVAGQLATKPGHSVDTELDITVKARPRFVGRGGEKLDAAFEAFGLAVEGRVCLDTGASTGGFTDCMLQRGAAQVYAVDVGRGQLHWRLRNDPRVTVMEGVNARYLDSASFVPPPEFAALDVSFISLTKVLPAVKDVLAGLGVLVTLIKPQFEAGREQVRRGGVVRDPAVHQEVLAHIRRFGEESLGLCWQGVCESPLKGPAGNTEFLAWWVKSGRVEQEAR